MKPLNIALNFFGIAFLLAMFCTGWTLHDPHLYIFWEFNMITLMATLLSITSFFIGIGWGFLLYHRMAKKHKL